MGNTRSTEGLTSYLVTWGPATQSVYSPTLFLYNHESYPVWDNSDCIQTVRNRMLKKNTTTWEIIAPVISEQQNYWS